MKNRGLAVYLDVSGSVNDYLPEIVGVLHSLKGELTSIFLFSNKVVETPFKALLAGKVRTTYGTDFNCIADSILERGFDKAVILTDGYASLDEDKQAELKKRKLQALTILFGGKEDCDEFAPFGDVVQLDDITDGQEVKPMEYRVIWTIDLDADSPEDAARKALQIQRVPDSWATHFEVRDAQGRVHEVDLGYPVEPTRSTSIE